ncbi:uncharacterized protein LOC143288209 [Babylonia areolata]|uniref:uncharacterized protein LOC143288209 n=1 Tax=Babylonia areolata TaxID=304850 RepID=UPI003FD2C8B6
MSRAVRSSQQRAQYPGRSNSLTPGATSPPHTGSQLGVQGSAMNVPPPRPYSQAAGRRSSVSHEACEEQRRKMLERQRQLEEQLQQAQRELARWKSEVGQKDKVIHTLTAENSAMKSSHEAALSAEREKQARQQEEMQRLQTQLQEALDQGQVTKARLEDLQKEMKDMMAAKDKEIADKDLTIKRLRAQLEESQKSSSLDRQRQLGELNLELKSLRQEADSLRNNLKTLASTKPKKECGRCAEAVNRAEKLAVTLKEREVTIGQLKTLCSRFEQQLSQQDVLMKHWADSKGHRLQ